MDMIGLKIIDINWRWRDGYIQSLKLFEKESGDRIQEVSLSGLIFNWKLSIERYCPGYFIEGKHNPCPDNSMIGTGYEQCLKCDRKQGFRSAFLFKEEPKPHIKKYLSQPHFIYLAYFEPGLIKVGTASKSRKKARLIEQDALVYSFIAKSDGFSIQDLERTISKECGLPERITNAHKLKYLTEVLRIPVAERLIEETYTKIFKLFGKSSEFEEWFFPKESFRIENLTSLPDLYFPDKKVHFLKHENVLFGKFLGLRGRFLLIENNGEIIAFDKKDLAGRKIEGIVEDYKYPIQKDEQIGLL